MFGISYNLQQFNWQNITFYDGKCRTCNNGILNDALIENTCVTKNSKVCGEIVYILVKL